MEPTDDHENKNKENEQTTEQLPSSALFVKSKKRNVPVSSLSASEDEEASRNIKRAKSEESFEDVVKTAINEAISMSPDSDKEDAREKEKETFTLPTLKIQPIFGGKPLSFPVHPRLALIDLKDFILFTLSIPHPQQILSFYNGDVEQKEKTVILSNYSENTLLSSVPGLIDEFTGRCAPISLSFKISSGMDFSVHASDAEYEASGNDFMVGSDGESGSGFFELSNDPSSNCSKLSALAASIASIIPFPPGIDKSARMLFRSLSKSSPLNNNLPTLWEIYFPESGVKMIVTALINVNEIRDEEEEKELVSKAAAASSSSDGSDETIQFPIIPVPNLIITPEQEEKSPSTSTTSTNLPLPPSQTVTDSSSTIDSINPKLYCEKCRIKCRPALRFICKCHRTFCQSHRYPDQHECTYDHRAEGLATIQANNPKIVKDKVGNF